jgi:hypothetical protein
MGGMSDLDLSIRELIFEGTLEENIKENVGTKIKIKDYTHIVSEKEIRDYYYWYRENEEEELDQYLKNPNRAPISQKFSKEIDKLQRKLDKI